MLCGVIAPLLRPRLLLLFLSSRTPAAWIHSACHVVHGLLSSHVREPAAAVPEGLPGESVSQQPGLFICKGMQGAKALLFGEGVDDGLRHTKIVCGGDFEIHGGTIHHPDRFTTPMIREGEGFRPASWDEALDLVAARFKELKDKYGPATVGGVSSTRCTNEENFLFAKWVRTTLGTNNVDNCARV